MLLGSIANARTLRGGRDEIELESPCVARSESRWRAIDHERGSVSSLDR
jgi:hypothetical protein